jgi:hypothetical protein
VQAQNDAFRVTVARLGGHFTLDDRSQVNAVLTRAKDADFMVIDLRHATFDNVCAFRFFGGRNNQPRSLAHVRLIVSKDENAFNRFDAFNRISVLRDIDLQKPGDFPELDWEEFTVTAGERPPLYAAT